MRIASVRGIITIRIVVWLASVLVAPFVIQYLTKQKEIQGEADYFKSLVLSLLLFFIAFTPFFFPKAFLFSFRRHFFLVSIIWFVAGTVLNGYLAKIYLNIDYLKGLVLWLLAFIVSSAAGFVLTSFSLFFLRTLR